MKELFPIGDYPHHFSLNMHVTHTTEAIRNEDAQIQFEGIFFQEKKYVSGT